MRLNGDQWAAIQAAGDNTSRSQAPAAMVATLEQVLEATGGRIHRVDLIQFVSWLLDLDQDAAGLAIAGMDVTVYEEEWVA